MLVDLNLYQFKRFKNENIELSQLTLLTGVNGMGKSSVIQALIILRQSFDRGELQNNGKLIIEDKDLVNLISPDDMLYADADDKKVAITLEDDRENKATWVVIAEGTSNTLPYEYQNKEGDIYDSSLFADTFQYLEAERIGPRVSYDRLTVNRAHSPIGYRGEFVANRILDAVTNLEKVALEKVILGKGGKNIYDQLSTWVSEIIYPDTKVLIDGSNSSKIDLKYSFKEQPTKVFNPMNIGFGFSYALPVIVAILTAKPGSLLIVENPEAHLHPKGQSRMGMLLALAAESGLQIIVETHSDHLLNGIRVVARGKTDYGSINAGNIKVHFFKRELMEDGSYINKRSLSVSSSGKLSGWPLGFFDEWENNLRHLIS
ncbi:MAG: DUF3696 domain-containing protein [Bacteroidota bacterium]